MEILPLHKLFTTKEDRLGAFKLIQYGSQYASDKFLEDLSRASVEGGDVSMQLLRDSEATEVESESKGEDKAQKLAEDSGIDLLTIKQYLFCDLMSRSGNEKINDGRYQPFACATVEEVDSLGKQAFGSQWEAETSGATKTYVLKRNGCKEYRDFLTKRKLAEVPLPHPYVYPEMDGTYYGGDTPGFSICTVYALLVVGSRLSKVLKGRMQYLKDYLNNKADRVVDEHIDKLLEQAFFCHIFVCKAEMLGTNLHDTGYLGMNGAYAGLWHRLFPGSYDLPKFVLRYGGAGGEQLWDAYRTALLDCGYYTVHCRSGRTPCLEGTREEQEFFVDNVWFRLLKKNFTNVITSVSFRRKLTNRTTLMLIADVDLSLWDSMGGYGFMQTEDGAVSICYLDTEECVNVQYDIVDLPDDFDKKANSEVLIYTACVCRLLWEWGNTQNKFSTVFEKFVSEQRPISYTPKVLITNSCLVSHIRRAGFETYFAFRSDDAEGEPLVLYVDTEEDKQFVEECAKSVGASLTNGKNELVLLSRGAELDFNELKSDIDCVSKSALLEELFRASLLLFMLGTDSSLMHLRGVYSWHRGTIYTDKEFIDPVTGEVLNNRSEALLYTWDGKTFMRKALDLHRVLEYHKDTILPLGSVFACDLRDRAVRDIFVDEVVLDEVDAYYLAFPRADALLNALENNKTYPLNLPVLIKGSHCKVVRWDEILQLVPEFEDSWSYIDTIPMATLRKYISAVFAMQLL